MKRVVSKEKKEKVERLIAESIQFAVRVANRGLGDDAEVVAEIVEQSPRGIMLEIRGVSHTRYVKWEERMWIDTNQLFG